MKVNLALTVVTPENVGEILYKSAEMPFPPCVGMKIVSDDFVNLHNLFEATVQDIAFVLEKQSYSVRLVPFRVPDQETGRKCLNELMENGWETLGKRHGRP